MESRNPWNGGAAYLRIIGTGVPKIGDADFFMSSASLAWYPARRKSAWYTLMRFRSIKNGIAHTCDVYTV